MVGALTSYIDVAQVALYVFWGFFFSLIFYLRREDKREGYPLVTDRAPFGRIEGFPKMPAPKTFLLPAGGSVTAPRAVDHPEPPFEGVPTGLWPGAPWTPVGNALLSGLGPNAATMRDDVPDMTYPDPDHGSLPRVVPMRVANDHFPDPDGVDVRGLPVIGADGLVAGTVSDLWIDRSETVVRYLQVALTDGGTVLLPLPLAVVDLDGTKVRVSSVLSTQFADAPRVANPNQVTLREEDKIQAYFASGHLLPHPAGWSR